MSYGAAAALQAAIYQRLAADPALDALVQGAVHDALPPGPVPPLYVSIGPEDVRDRSDKTGAGALHRFTISVVSTTAGFAEAKAAAAAVSDALTGARLTLARGSLVSLTFDRARARRDGDGNTRRVDLRFRARVDDQ